MDIVILENSEQVAQEAARMLARLLRATPSAVLGLPTGQTPRAMYRELVREHREHGLSFRDATTFNLDEYIGLEPGSPPSYRAYMQRELFDHVDLDPANTFLPECPPGADPRTVGPTYEAEIARRGGIDLQVLGVGVNGHIGFNEPASSLASRTRIKTLTRETIEVNRPLFDDPAAQPRLAITMGIATIMEAREVLLLATGESKADAVHRLVEGPVSARCPASILQMHEKVTVLLDEASAARLELRDYYDWVAAQKRALFDAFGESG
jgi:glucosamine-6-phosphate deaminase